MSLIRNHPGFVLLPNHGDLEPSATMLLTVTVSGNSSTSQPHLQELPVVDSAISFIARTETATATQAHSESTSALQALAEAEVLKGSASLEKVLPKFAERVGQVPVGLTSVTTNAGPGLGSVLSNLEGIMKVADLLADVSELGFLGSCLFQ